MTTYWLATINRDGSPHVMPVGMFWDDGTFWFTSGDGTRKSRNLAVDPRRMVTVSTTPFSAPAAGPPPWYVYRITARTVFALAASEPGGATRFDLQT